MCWSCGASDLASQFWFLFPFLVQLQDRVTALGLGVTGPFVDEHVDENTARFNRLTTLHINFLAPVEFNTFLYSRHPLSRNNRQGVLGKLDSVIY